MIMKMKFFILGMDCFRQSTPLIPLPIIGSIIEGSGSLLGSGISALAQNASNKAYLKGVRETNELNRELYNKQVSDNRLNTALENAYNAPSAQLSRLRQAGINSSDVSSGTMSPISSANASPAVAPSQTPNPFHNFDLGKIASDALEGYQRGQQIQDMNMSLYQHGIDSVMYYKTKIAEYDRLITENLQNKERNHILNVELEKLLFERDHMQQEWEIHMRQSDDEHKKALSEQEYNNAQIARLQSQTVVENRLADIQESMSRVAWKRVNNETRDLVWRLQDMTHKWNLDYKVLSRDDDYRKLRNEIMSLDRESRRIAALQVMDEYLKNHEQFNSPFNWFLRKTFGVEVKDILGVASGAVLFKLLKGGKTSSNPYGDNASYSY